MLSAIVPAAGLSTRFVGNKLVYIYKGRPLIARTLKILLDSGVVSRVVLVLGSDATRVFDAVIRFVEPGDLSKLVVRYNGFYYSGGMSTSIKLGLEATCESDDILIHPADVAMVRPSTVKYVYSLFLKTSKPVGVACYKNVPGHPILFKRSLRSALFEINEETQGLKGLLRPLYSRGMVECIETGDPNVLRDVDEMADVHASGEEIYQRKLRRVRNV